MANTKTAKADLNQTITAMFEDERWGQDGEGNPNFISADIDAKAFDALSKIKIGDKVKFKRTTSKSGKSMAYLEIVKNNGFKKATTRNEGNKTTGF